MGIVNSILMAALLGSTAAASAQTTAPMATSSTQAAAPASISPAATNAQAASAAATANSATRGSNGAADASGTAANGITGVSRSRSASRGPAPNATGKVEVIGETKRAGKRDATAHLPGIASFGNGVKSGTPIQVRLQNPVDSGHAKNGDILRGVLAAPVGDVPAGAPVELTVVAAAAAGQISSAGELSLQVIKINGDAVLSEVVTATGQEGKKVIADAAPERGTEASFTPDQTLTLPAA